MGSPEDLIGRQLEVLLSLSASIVIVILLMFLVSGTIKIWPNFNRAGVFQVIVLFSDVSILISLGIMIGLASMN